MEIQVFDPKAVAERQRDEAVRERDRYRTIAELAAELLLQWGTVKMTAAKTRLGEALKEAGLAKHHGRP